ncbi:MAG: right-handed parallel beta-helix repeat-containing protein [Promethearchaeota archaeon]|nr:MAG: right-handed parallel beta-helix repeat-containing protein [Candidatus Lokiarchaeota archaeon]
MSGRIIIANNWSVARANDICTGSGTFLDPYVIEDLIIDGGGIGIGIAIGSKKEYFRIENCTIFNCEIGIKFTWTCNGTLLNNNCSNNDLGIYLDGWTDILNPPQEIIDQCYCMNNTIVNNTINNNAQEGISIRNCDNNTIIGNFINFNYDGIFLTMHSDNNSIQENYLQKNERLGFYFYQGSNNIIKRNSMESCGFYSDFWAFKANEIDETNLINDGHLYFYANRTNLNEVDFSNAGQIYLENCNHSIISNLDLSDGCISISLTDCNYIRILNNNLSSNCFYGINAVNCNNMTIESNFIDDNLNGGIDFSNGVKNKFINNIIRNNGFRAGIRAFGWCNDNLFLNNRFKNNFEGLSFGLSCTNNCISENSFIGNTLSGITFEGGCEFNSIFSNFFRKNSKHCAQTVINNFWNNSEIGNYWDNYTGFDLNGDGIGDTPHNISISPLIQDFLPIVDNDSPEITILLPSNNSVFGSIAPNFQIKVNERFLQTLFYTLDGGLTNYTFTENGTIDQTAWNLLPMGQVKLRFYAIDKVGNMAYREILIIKQKEAAIPGINPLLLLGMTLVYIYISIKIVNKKRKKN